MAVFCRLHTFLRREWRLTALLFAAAILILVAGCSSVNLNAGNSSSGPTITSVALTCSPTSIFTNQTSTCTPVVSGTGNYSTAVSWTVVPVSMGTVSSAGVFTPAGAGTALIFAASTQDSSQYGTATVTVTPPSSITSVSVACFPSSILPTQTSACEATVVGSGAYSSTVNWAATGGSITSSGVFTPAALGTANITATSTQDSSISGSATVAVNNPVPVITALSPASLALQTTPQALTISGTGFLSSSTVTLNGVSHAVTFINAGELVIFLTAADLAATGTYPVVVTNPAPGGGPSTAADFTVTAWQTSIQILPLYPHSWGFFAGVSTVAPSGIANWPNYLGQLSVTGAAGSGTLTLNGMVVVGSGGIGDYCTTADWASIIQHDDGSYGAYTVASCNSTTVNIYPTLAKNVTAQNLWNLWDGVEGEHMTSVGYTGLATWLFNLKQYQGYIGEVAGGRWFDAYGNAYGTEYTLTGGLTTTGDFISGANIYQGLYEGTSYPAYNGFYAPLLYASHSRDPNATSICGLPYRSEVGAWLAGQGVTHSVYLGGLSGYLHAFIGASGQSGATLPSRLTVTVVVDGVTLYSNTAIAGLTEITVPFTNGNTGTFNVSLTGNAPTAFDISDYVWYVWPSTLDAQMQQPLFLPSSYTVVDADSWGVQHGGGFAAPLQSLLATNPAGASTGFTNASKGGQTAIWAISNYATAVQPLDPNYVVFDYQINDLNSGVITAYTITNGGTYASAPKVTISGCAGTPATATAILTGNQVTGLVFGDVGTECTSPTATFTPPGATAAFTVSPDTPDQLVSSIQTLQGLATAGATTPIYLRSLLTAASGQTNVIDKDEQQFNTISIVVP